MRSTTRLSGLTLFLAAALAGCGGGGDDGTNPTSVGGFTVTLSASTLSVEQGGTGSVTATIARTGSFTGTVNLSTESVPPGINASFNPSAITSGTTSTTLAVAVAGTVAPGAYTFTIRGQASGIADQRTATVSLTVTARPAIAIALTPTAGTATQGGSSSFTANITRTNYTGAVTVAISGAPSGVTTTVTPSGDAHAVAVSVGAAVAVGTYQLLATATGTGVAAVSAQFALTVNAPAAASIALAASPAALTTSAGGSAVNSTITITRTNFTGAVTLVASGAPTGVTTAIATSPTTGNTATLTLTAGAATTPGTYSVTVTGSGTGVSNATTQVSLTVTGAASIALAANPTALTATAGGAAVNSTITITRTNFTDAVTLAATGAPTGVAVAIATSPTTGNSATVTFTAGAATVPGTYPVTITGSGTGVANATTQVSLTVTAAAGIVLSASASTVTVQQGASGNTTINIARTNFTGAVSLAATGAPNGVTVSFNTSPTTANSATVTFAVGATVPAGSYPVTVTGSGTGITNAQIQVTLTVTQASGGGNVTFSFCGSSLVPIWLAVQNGTSGAWTQVAVGANNTWSFNITNLGGVAWVTQSGSGFTLSIIYGAQGELSQRGNNCLSPTLKSVTGTVAGLGATDQAFLNLGGGTPSSPPTPQLPNFTINGVPDGPRDLLGARGGLNISNPAAGFVINKLYIKRALNPANNSSIGTVDFNGTDAFDPDSKTATLNGVAGGEQVSAFATFVTGNGSALALGFGIPGSTSTVSYAAVPFAKTIAGDLHSLGASALVISGTDIQQRTVTTLFRDATNATLTLGAPLSTPAVSAAATTPYARLRTLLARQTDYNNFWYTTYSQGSGTSARTAIIQMTEGYIGSATSFDVTIPDFTGVGGWQNTWAPQTGLSTAWSTFAIGWVLGGGGQVEGALTKSALKTGSVTP